MRYAEAYNGGLAPIQRKLKVGASVVKGQLLILDSAGPGYVTDPTNTYTAADQIGVALEDATYSTTQGSEGTVQAVVNPMAVYEAVVSGGTNDDEDTALVITENNTASAAGTTVVDSDLPSDCMVGGLIYALTGNNAGQSRIITTYTSATCLIVTVPFNTTIASGDKFLVFGFAPWITVNLCLTTNFTQVPQHQPGAIGTGAALHCVDIKINDYDPAAPTAKVYFTLRDHASNPVS